MTIALLKGHLSIYDSELERLGIQMKIRQYNYQFNDEKYLYSFEGNINISENNSNIDIYEKLFFVCVNSIIVNKKEENIINLKGVKSQKLIEVKIAQKNYDFILDTGASVSLISKSIINNLLKEGIISNRNFLGKDYTKTADGTKHLVEFWNLPHIIIGDKKIYDINFAVMDNNIDPLLGMNIINKLNIWKIDLVNNKIYLNN